MPSKTKRIFIAFAILAFFGLAKNSRAADFYVAINGSDNMGNGSLVSPWRTPEYGAGQLQAGDTLYIRQGTYDIDTHFTANQKASIVPAANGCTISGYPGETAVIRGDSGAGPGVGPTGGVIGAFDGTTARSDITIKDLTIQGVVVLFGTRATLENCDVSVGADNWPGTQQGEVVWVSNCDDCVIRNNKLHDNFWGLESNVPANNGLIMVYDSQRLLVENNDLYNSVGAGINLKDMGDAGHIVRMNHIYDNEYSAVWTANQDSTGPGSSIYQNVIRNNNQSNHAEHGALTLVIAHENLQVYNNTFYQNYQGDLLQWTNGGAVTFSFFNNVSAAPQAHHLNWPYGASVFGGSYLDYNSYYNDVSWNYRGSVSQSLSAWQTQAQSLLSGAEAHSVVSDPGFLNSSGQFNSPADFKRSFYPADGRGGEYPSVMGAYITGNETIGYTASSNQPDTTAPASPTSLTIR